MRANSPAPFAPVNKIIPFSLVDGPGSRTSVFLQGCNIACAYCHNPETQRLCVACGACVAQCPTGALTRENGRVVWDEGKCVQCDGCIQTCRRFASPKIKRMSAREMFDVCHGYQPFIRGVTVSGGECMLHADWIEELFGRCREAGLGTLIDSNGMVPFAGKESLLEVTDGVMLDVKAWDAQVYKKLTGADNAVVKENLALLNDTGKIEELRVVVVPGWTDPEDTIGGIAKTIGGKVSCTTLKLIKFRCFGVRGVLGTEPSPTDERMHELEALAQSVGFERVEIR